MNQTDVKPMSDVTVILEAIDCGCASTDELLPIVYDELRRLAVGQMKDESPGHTLQATALVHEAFLRLTSGSACTWENRRHFFGAAAEAMRRILVEQARRKARAKHGGEMKRVELPEIEVFHEALGAEEIRALDAALAEFERAEPEKCELVKLRYFAGLQESEAARALGISRATASRWWAYSKAWLFERIRGELDSWN